ncbi:MAG: DsrE family protein [Pseudomonadota bacterium]
MKRFFTPMIAAAMLATAPMAAQAAEEKVVYHVNDAAVARAAMNNVNNHLNASPDAKIVIVTHGKGIDFLLNDAKDDKGDYMAQIAGLSAKGVKFNVCANTLKARKLDNSAVVQEATVVPSGVAEVAKLQAQEGYVYLKP